MTLDNPITDPMATPPTSEQISPLRFTILAPPAYFVGRKRELEELLAHAEQGVVITSATASVGIGKTTLARQLASLVAERFPDGRMELDLKGEALPPMQPMDPLDAQRRLLQPFYPNEPLPESTKELSKLYRKTFSSHKVLLLLDNAATDNQVRRLLPPEPSAAIVTTHAELSAAAGKLHTIELGGLRPEEARELLLSIAVMLDHSSRRQLDQLSAQLRHLPMALRVAGALLKNPPGWMLRTLLKRFAVARQSLAPLRTPNDPHLDVLAMLELTNEAMSEAVKRRFPALAVFPAPFDQATAQAVWGESALETDITLQELVYLNLLDFYPDQGLYYLHDLPRTYAQEVLLGQSEEARTVMERYANHILTQASAINTALLNQSATVEHELARFAHLRPHLQTAWARLSEVEVGWPVPTQAPRWLCDFPMRVSALLVLTLLPTERRAVLEHALTAARQLGDADSEGLHLAGLGRLCLAEDPARALAYHDQQLQISYALHNRYLESDALAQIGLASKALGDYRRAWESWRMARALFQITDPPRVTEVEQWLLALKRDALRQRT